MPTRVADYIAQTLARHGVRHVFMVTGGGAMHLNDAFGRCKDMTYVACHHEQACAMAADSYARMSGRMAAVNVTTGPGGTNAITGIYGAYVDSLPVFVVSGQVRWETLVRSTGLPLRQLGDQELDIVKMVKTITKYAEMVTDPKTIRYHLERALHLATSGRPGPVWLDIPMNVQGALIEPDALVGYDPKEDAPTWQTADLAAACRQTLELLARAKRPVVIPGAGIRVSGQHGEFLRFVERLGVPVATAWNAHDVLPDSHPLYVGRPGTLGDRAGNFAVQNADFVLVLGSRLNIRQISFNWKAFARAAKKVMVDIDAAELAKPTLAIDLPIHASLQDFFAAMEKLPAPAPAQAHADYLAWCRSRRARYPVVKEEYWAKASPVNPYCFAQQLFRQLPEGERVVTGDGTACVVTFQAAELKEGQRLYTNSGCASMGYDLPGAVGACIATGKKRLICLAGDGSMMMNLQELQTIVTQKLPIKIFVLNNTGYHSIRQTQQNYFADNIVGCGPESGLEFPDFAKVAAAFDIPFTRVDTHPDLERAIGETISGDGPRMCEVVLDLEQAFSPKLASRKLPDGRMLTPSLEDMAPFLSRAEMAENMVIPLLDGDPP